MKRKFLTTIMSIGLLLGSSIGYAQPFAFYGNGSDGNLTVNSLNSPYYMDNVKYKVEDIDITRFKVEVSSLSGFSIGDQVLIVQMENPSGSSTGTFQMEEVTDLISTGGGAPFYVEILNPLGGAFTVTNSDDRVQILRVPQFDDLNVATAGKITCSAWDGDVGGIVCFLVAGTLTFTYNGYIDVSEKGYFNNNSGASGGSGGTASGDGGNGGNVSGDESLGFTGASATGGSSTNIGRTGGKVQFGSTVTESRQGGTGGAGTQAVDGSTGGTGFTPTIHGYSQERIVGTQDGTLILGNAGACGDGGDGAQAGGNGGGGGSNAENDGNRGEKGTNGGDGGDGGTGGKGGGIIYIRAVNTAYNSMIEPQYKVLRANGGPGGNGTVGGDGGDGGDGGSGAAGYCSGSTGKPVPHGGGGHPGSPGKGANGGNGGDGGDGGTIWLYYKTTNVISILNDIVVGGGDGGYGGAGGDGGEEGDGTDGSKVDLSGCGYTGTLAGWHYPGIYTETHYCDCDKAMCLFSEMTYRVQTSSGVDRFNTDNVYTNNECRYVKDAQNEYYLECQYHDYQSMTSTTGEIDRTAWAQCYMKKETSCPQIMQNASDYIDVNEPLGSGTCDLDSDPNLIELEGGDITYSSEVTVDGFEFDFDDISASLHCDGMGCGGGECPFELDCLDGEDGLEGNDGVFGSSEQGKRVFRQETTLKWNPTDIKLVEVNDWGINLYPNPTSASLYLDFNSEKSEVITVNIMDAQGRLILSLSKEINNGENSIKINVEDLPSQTYFIEVTGENKTSRIKFIKE